MIQDQKLTQLAALFYQQLKEHPLQFFPIQSLSSLPEWKEMELQLSYISHHHQGIASKLLEKEGVYALGNKKSPLFFYSEAKMPKSWTWTDHLVKKWMNWVPENRLKPVEDFGPFPGMPIPSKIQPCTFSSYVRLKLFFPYQIQVKWKGQQSTNWIIPLLKKSYLKPF